MGIMVAGDPAGRQTRLGPGDMMWLVAVDASPGGPRVGSLGPRGYPADPTTYTEVIPPR